MPAGTPEEVPAGIALDLLLAEVRGNIRSPHDPHPFELPIAEGFAVVRLSDEGFSDRSAWWLAREASVSQCVAELSED